MPFAPVPAVVFAGGLLRIQFFVMPFAPVPAVVFAGGLLRHGVLQILHSRHCAGGPLQQVRTDHLLAEDQQHAVAAGLAAAGRRDQRSPLFHRLALVTGQIHAALLHHPVKSRKAVVPLAGDLDLIRRDGRPVHIHPIAGEPGLDVLCALNTVDRRTGSRRHRPCADVAPQQRTADHQRTAHRSQPQLFQTRFVHGHHKHIPTPPQPDFRAAHSRILESLYAAGRGDMQKGLLHESRAAAPAVIQCAFAKSSGDTAPCWASTLRRICITPYSVLDGARNGTRTRSSGLPFSIRKP